jgi:myo-inositol-1(or 4)-monophosphatase
MEWQDKTETALHIAKGAGTLALDYFRKLDTLRIDQKGHQDFVTEADRNVELSMRAALAKAFPDDGIVGEEHAPTPGTSGFTWVIDPIDGTANFINAIPLWCVILAGVCEGKTRIGIIYDPVHDEAFVATRGGGATLNGAAMRVSAGKGIGDGTIGIGSNGRKRPESFMRAVQGLTAEGGVMVRNASGGLSLAYTAAGRFLGYIEDHMNAWDCLAGQLLIQEAGGHIEEQDADDMIAVGGRVVVGSAEVFDDLLRIAKAAFTP